MKYIGLILSRIKVVCNWAPFTQFLLYTVHTWVHSM